MNPKIYPTVLCLALLCTGVTYGQKGKDGIKNYSTAGTYILNRYTSLASSALAGDMSITVASAANLSGSVSFTNSVNPYTTNAITVGDLILIVQVQGATIGTSNTINYGTISAYNNTGNYEVKYVLGVAGNVINFCTGLANAYNEGGTARTEVIRIPRLSSLTVGAGVTLTGSSWTGATETGGIVALEVSGNIVLNGTISASGIGFAGGTDPDPSSSSTAGSGVVTIYRSTATNNVAGKGESIAGTIADYASLLGPNGRGAPANGGGGANGHNTGGGGGSNAGANGVLAPWDGTGLKDISTPSWANAWNLEAAGFSTSVSIGGGRGGYSYCNSDQDALTVAPGNSVWSGDWRDNVGGLGGHPLNYNGDTRLFMGGGGGAGDANNNVGGNGANGGGIAYILCNGSVSGSGVLSANGSTGFPATSGFPNDAAGGGGGGGAINALVNGTITGISIQANGGTGGLQPAIATEAEGPGGGGGGGYIATTATAVTKQVNGGANGVTASALVTEFPANGATKGNAGTTAVKTFTDVENCSLLLPVQFVSFVAAADTAAVSLAWKTGTTIDNTIFSIERSRDGSSFASIGTTAGYNFTDNNLPGNTTILFYRIKQTDADGRYSYSPVAKATINSRELASLLVSPNPAKESIQVTYNSPEQGSMSVGIFNENGLLVKTMHMNVCKGTNSFFVRELDKLPPAHYILRVQQGKNILNKTFVIL